MIAECAVEPDVMAEWRHFQSLEEDFGVKQARLICEFPGKWRLKVIDRAAELVKEGKNTEMQRARMLDIMQSTRFRQKLISAGPNRNYDGNQSWLANAKNTKAPFDIILKSSPGSGGKSICGDELVKSEPPFKVGAQAWVERTPDKLIGAAETLLRRCKILMIVEPNFCADEPRFQLTFIHLFEKLEAWGVKIPCIELHTRQTRNEREEFIPFRREASLRHSLKAHLPQNCELKVCHWSRLPSGGKLHPRFIITDAVGLHFDYGLDEAKNDRTLVSTLEDEICEGLRSQLSEAGPDRHEIVIKG